MKFITIDEAGYLDLNGLRVTDEEYGRTLLQNLTPLDNQSKAFVTLDGSEKIFVEAFDEPFVARQVIRDGPKFFIQLPYQLKFEFDPSLITLDEWDRFHGVVNSIPFVMSRPAQNEFFNLLDAFDDDSITINKKKINTAPLFQPLQNINEENFWSDVYKSTNNNPPWNLNSPHPFLATTLPQLKIPKSKILVLGCGYGHDAAFLAKAGHFVTAVDFSPQAIEGAKKLYGDIQNLKFERHDAFLLPAHFENAFDIVFEHTFFCAIDPGKRNEIIKIWKNCLVETGHILGLFFVHHSYNAPPFGATEWELRERLKSRFQFLYWSRWRQTSARTTTMELILYAKRRAS